MMIFLKTFQQKIEKKAVRKSLKNMYKGCLNCEAAFLIVAPTGIEPVSKV